MRQLSTQIGAERRPGTATFESIDPYTGEPWAVLPGATEYLRDKAGWIETTGGTRDPFVLG